MSSLGLMEVQRALYTKLSGDGVLMGMVTGIYDNVPQKTAFPYVVIGDGNYATIPAEGANLSECRLQLDVWSEVGGRKTVLAIMNRLVALLHLGTLTLTGYQLVLLRCLQSDTTLDEQGTYVHGTLGVIVAVAEA